MSETQAASAPQPAGKGSAKKKTTKSPSKKSKAPSNHPKYVDMAISAIKALKERNGSSRQAVHKYILSNFKVGTDVKAVNSHLKQALKRGVASGKLKHVKGQGASGSFKLSEGAAAKKAKTPKKAKSSKPKSKSPKKAGNPKPKKSSPKKAKKPKKAAAKKAAAPAAAAASAAPTASAPKAAPKKEKKAKKQKSPSKPKPKAAKKKSPAKKKSSPKKKAAPKKK
jgi:histone H1/5